VPEFCRIFKIVAALAVLSAVLAVAMTVLNVFLPTPLGADVAHAFVEAFKACIFAILGLLGGGGATPSRTSRRHSRPSAAKSSKAGL
jgi:hypothetical protein